jgi:hypothetical protein
MSKRSRPASDFFTLGFAAPLVVTLRLQQLAMEAFRPTPAGRREAQRMVSEKPVAFARGAAAGQQALFTAGLKFWSDMAAAFGALTMAAFLGSYSAAARPALARVRANARRLTR